MQKSYDEGVTDEFIKPLVLTDDAGEPLAKIKEGDVVIFFNCFFFIIFLAPDLTARFFFASFSELIRRNASLGVSSFGFNATFLAAIATASAKWILLISSIPMLVLVWWHYLLHTDNWDDDILWKQQSNKNIDGACRQCMQKKRGKIRGKLSGGRVKYY